MMREEGGRKKSSLLMKISFPSCAVNSFFSFFKKGQLCVHIRHNPTHIREMKKEEEEGEERKLNRPSNPTPFSFPDFLLAEGGKRNFFFLGGGGEGKETEI